MSTCVSCPPLVEAVEDSIRAAVDLAPCSVCSPRHWVDWYVVHAVATAATASRIVAIRSTRCERRSASAIGQVNTFTARAMTRPSTVSEISDCTAIMSFAQFFMGITSVGLNAVLVVIPRMK